MLRIFFPSISKLTQQSSSIVRFCSGISSSVTTPHVAPFVASVLGQGKITLSSLQGGLGSQWAGATSVESDAGGDGSTRRIEQPGHPAFTVFATFNGTEMKSPRVVLPGMISIEILCLASLGQSGPQQKEG